MFLDISKICPPLARSTPPCYTQNHTGVAMGRAQRAAEFVGRGRAARRLALIAAAWGTALVSGSAVAVESDVAPKTELEAAAQALIAPIAQRHVVRSAEGGVELWLISDVAFEKAVAEARRTISTKRALQGAFTLEKWTYVDADRSGLMELVGGSMPRRLRLTRHLHGVLLEVQDGADASEAPRWLPPFRPQAQPLMHGAMLR